MKLTGLGFKVNLEESELVYRVSVGAGQFLDMHDCLAVMMIHE